MLTGHGNRDRNGQNVRWSGKEWKTCLTKVLKIVASGKRANHLWKWAEFGPCVRKRTHTFHLLCLAMRRLQTKKYTEVWGFQPARLLRPTLTASVGKAVCEQAAPGFARGRACWEALRRRDFGDAHQNLNKYILFGPTILCLWFYCRD